MRLLKLSLVTVLAIGLCSFAIFQEDGRSKLYKTFLKEFDNKVAPAKFTLKTTKRVLNHNKIQTQQKAESELSPKDHTEPLPKRNILGNDFEKFIPGISRGMMSRLGPSTYEAEVLVANEKKFDAVIYSSSRSFDFGSKSYTLATFDKEGNRIEAKSLGHIYGGRELDVNINKQLEMTVTHMAPTDNQERLASENIRKIFITPKGEIMVHDTSLPTKKGKTKEIKPTFG